MKTIVKILLIVLTLLALVGSMHAQSWHKSYTAGSNDVNGNFMGGSEVLQLVGHKARLYASVGYWEDENNIWYGGTNGSRGWGQIIRLDMPGGQWQEDFFLGASYLRPEVLKQLIFTQDVSGTLLLSPDTVLVAAGYTTNYLTGTVRVKSFARNDQNGSWGESQITQGGLPAGENYSIRDIEVYKDRMTGLERVYASVGTKGIFVGKYNPLTPGKIDWTPNPEVGPLSIRPLGITTANEALYFSSGNKLYRRSDGISPTYTIAHDMSDLSTSINSAVGGIRGLTTLSRPASQTDALLLMWCPGGKSQGIIYRLEPDGSGGFNRLLEIDVAVLVETYLPGTDVRYLLGAYNEFYEYVDPLTADTLHIVGMEARIQGGGYPEWNGFYRGALFAKRDTRGQYSLEEVNGIIGKNDKALVANRCYILSPFGQEDAIYFGGFDPNSNAATNRAWVFKQNNQTSSLDEDIETEINFVLYPNPATDQLFLENPTNTDHSYKIFSILGNMLMSGRVEPGKQVIDISGLSSQICFIHIGDKMMKFIKE